MTKWISNGVKCPLCGLEFSERDAQKVCSVCIMSKSCNLVKCPNCGYESPIESKLIQKIKKWRNRER